MIHLTRRYRFSASHRLHTDALPGEVNARLYGKCNNPFGHGHDYVLEVTVAGEIDPVSGRVVDRRTLDRLVAGQVLARFDHKNLNADVPDFAGIVPTSENVALAIRRRLAGCWKTAFPTGAPKLERITIRETRRNTFEIGYDK